MEPRVSKYYFLDTNVFIYFFQEHPKFGLKAKEIFSLISSGEISAVSSVLTLTELLSLSESEETVIKLHERFLETPNLYLQSVDSNIAVKASLLRRKYKFKIPDALQLASAIQVRATHFITNDKALKKCEEIRVVLLDEL